MKKLPPKPIGAVTAARVGFPWLVIECKSSSRSS